MIPIVSFIGRQDSGKTTIARQVVAILKEKGFRVGVIKSTHHTSINFDREGSDTHAYSKAGADIVALHAPDQMVTISHPPEMKLTDIVHRFFHDIDIIIGEGFKNERHISKIEVSREDGELLKDQVNGVVAVVTERNLPGETLFRPDQAVDIAQFIIERYIQDKDQPDVKAVLFVNGKKIPMKGFVQEALAGSVQGFISSLKKTENPQTIELRISLKSKEQQ
ncbi:MAG: molybdopterin-guanine dinucleotide biosynthesis protein B [Desulfobulbaceae bacterium]|nr:molybdopterin-guanine dinucleotide biosynthesis protein B [Desulfobulbaceae bacterium]